MKNALALLAGMFLLTFGCHHSVPLPSKVSEGDLIEAIDVRGNIQITNAVIRRGLHSRVGDRISLPVIQSDIQYLYSLGFEEVRVNEEPGNRGKVIAFSVKEKAVKSQRAAP